MIIGRFWSRAEARPDSVFCHFVEPRATTVLTYRAAAELAYAYKDAFGTIGGQRGDIVLIFLPHTPHLYGSFLGAMTAGLVPSFMPPPTIKQDPDLYWASHTQLVQRLGVRAIVSSGDLAAELAERLPGVRVINTEQIGLSTKRPASELDIGRPATDIALLQHSSGTTGLKKGVALSYGEIDSQLSLLSRALQARADDVVVSWLPLYHDMGLAACFLLPVYLGIPFVHMDPFHWLARPSLLLDLIGQHRGTLAWLPNFAFDHLVNTVPDRLLGLLDLSSLRCLTDCSEPCRPETIRRFLNKFATAGLSRTAVQCCYAMAEAVFAVTLTDPSREPEVRHFEIQEIGDGQVARPLVSPTETAASLLSNGKPLSGMQVQIRMSGTPQSELSVGEIHVSGPSVFQGYFRNPELTSERLRDGWYATRDLGFFCEGELYVLGRVDDVIITNGKNLFAHDIEAAMSGIAGLKAGRQVALGITDERLGTQRLAVIAEVDTDDEAALRAARRLIGSKVAAAAGLPPHAVHLVPSGWLVKTSSGKISRSANLSKLLATQEASNG